MTVTHPFISPNRIADATQLSGDHSPTTTKGCQQGKPEQLLPRISHEDVSSVTHSASDSPYTVVPPGCS